MSLDFLYPGLGSELVDYADAWELQRRLHAEVSAGTAPGTVLVLERLDGVPLGAAGNELAALPDSTRHDLANLLLSTVLDQVLVGGVFHSDLHPGNVLLGPDGELQLLDFGSVGRLDNGSRAAITGAAVTVIEEFLQPGSVDARLAALDVTA